MISSIDQSWRMAIAIALAATVGGCKVVSTDQDRELRERRSGSFDAGTYVARNWSAVVLPALDTHAVAIAALPAFPVKDAQAATSVGGRRASDGSAWTFVVKGEGRVASVDSFSPVGTIALSEPGQADVRLMTGPVLVSTALRDAIPTLRFDDFADQLVYASINKALNDRALGLARENTQGLKPGERVRFFGVVQEGPAGSALSVLPVRVERIADRN